MPGTAELFWYVKKDYSQIIVTPLVTLAEKLTAELKVGFFAITHEVFYSCLSTVISLNSLGYMVSAIIPKAGRLQGVGLMENCIMTKVIGPITENFYTLLPEWKQLITDLGYCDPSDDLTDDDFPKIPNLPVTVTSEFGKELIIRNMTMSDHRWLYGMLSQAANAGLGYSLDEFGPFDMYRKQNLTGEHVAVVELAETGEKIAAQLYTPSTFNRGEERLVDTSMVVDSTYKGIGIGREMMKMWFGICKELGYKAALTTVCLNNRASFAMARANDMAWVGAIPFAGFMKGEGWITTGICYKSLDSVKTYSQIIKERKQSKI